jgi:serine/threonine protein kinase
VQSQQQVERAKSAINQTDNNSPESSYIAKLIDLEEDEIFYYFAYERCVGSLLYLMHYRPPQNSDIKKFFEGAVKGLKSIHDSDFIHRNIRPQNIIVFENSVGKISDLLMSKQMNENSSMLSISCELSLHNVS